MELGYELLIFFAFLGAGIKAIDEVYDQGNMSRSIAYLLAPFIVALWLILSFYDKIATTILSAILVSSLLAGKVDNPVFRLSAGILVAVLLVRGVDIAFLPFLFLVFLGFVDEFLDGHADNQKFSRHGRFFLRHRFGMKLGVLLLFVFSQLELVYVMAFLAFDLAYDSVSIVLPRRVITPTGRPSEV